MMTMHATICKVECLDLLVCDKHTSQEVLVHMPEDCRCCFCPCDCICIEYCGAMTASIPPQISATCIRLISKGKKAPCC